MSANDDLQADIAEGIDKANAERTPKADHSRGLYQKYEVKRIDDPSGKHDDCEYFVLDWEHDRFAIAAAEAYARACESEFPELARGLRAQVKSYSAGVSKEDTNTERAALEEAARKATPGPWLWAPEDRERQLDLGGWRRRGVGVSTRQHSDNRADEGALLARRRSLHRRRLARRRASAARGAARGGAQRDTAKDALSRVRELAFVEARDTNGPAEERLLEICKAASASARVRDVPIVSAPQRDLLRYALEHAEGVNGALFLPWGNVRRDLHAACDRIGIPRCSPNDLRRTCATWLRADGASPDVISPVMGHADSRMVERVYGRLSTDQLAKRLARELGLPVTGNPRVTLDSVTPASQSLRAPLDSAESSDSETPCFEAIPVPRDGVEPPTRGFSIPTRLLPRPKKQAVSTQERQARHAGVTATQPRLRVVR